MVLPRNGDGYRWDGAPHLADTRVRRQGVGHVRVHQHRPVKGRVKTVSLKREGDRWYVAPACVQASAVPLPPTGATVGIDMGIASFLTSSDGTRIPDPLHGKTTAGAPAKVSGIHRKVARQRLDHAHKSALALVREHDLIAHEALTIVNMVKVPDPKPDPEKPGAYLPNGTAAKTGLNKSISDAGRGVFPGILAHKAESAGRVVVPVNPRNTSRTRLECGHTAQENRLTQDRFRCVECSFTEHADVVGATNILRAGPALHGTAQVSWEARRSSGGWSHVG